MSDIRKPNAEIRKKAEARNPKSTERGTHRSEIEKLAQLARKMGIQTSYVDTEGQRQLASPTALRSILGMWNIAADRPQDVEASLREQQQMEWRMGLEPVLVAWDGKPSGVKLRLPGKLDGEKVHCHVRLEDNALHHAALDSTQFRVSGQVKVDGSEFVEGRLTLPRLPLGYHQLNVEVGGWRRSALVISAPAITYWPQGSARRLGVFLPLYSIHSERSWGAGSLGELLKLADWFSSIGGRVVSTLPMLGAFLGLPFCEPSPYSPATRLFWNDFYIDVEKVPEFEQCSAARKLACSGEFRQQLDGFRRSKLVDYGAQMAARRRVLEPMARFFFAHESPRFRCFEQFLRERPEAEDYARFRATCEKAGAPWQRWEQRLQQGALRAGDYLEATKNYHLYVQWIAHEQMLSFRKECGRREIQFYLDLPLGVNSAGYDTWRERETFALGASTGAPPDFFFTKGQDWGFPPLHPERLRTTGYAYVREFLRFQMQHSDLLRIDHVMGLHRLYWIPPGLPPSKGAYVKYRSEELYAILSLESHRHRTGLIGENLGTVPPEVNKAMAQHGLRQIYVVQYQQRAGRGPALRHPPKPSVASLNTHDMPTFAAHWRGLDIDDRLKLGLIRPGQRAQKVEEREKLNGALVRFLRLKGYLTGPRTDPLAVAGACLAWLSSGPAEVVLVNVEDLWEETEPQNVPGTSSERPNWRRKSRLRIEEICRDTHIQKLLEGLARLRAKGQHSE